MNRSSKRDQGTGTVFRNSIATVLNYHHVLGFYSFLRRVRSGVRGEGEKLYKNKRGKNKKEFKCNGWRGRGKTREEWGEKKNKILSSSKSSNGLKERERKKKSESE